MPPVTRFCGGPGTWTRSIDLQLSERTCDQSGKPVYHSWIFGSTPAAGGALAIRPSPVMFVSTAASAAPSAGQLRRRATFSVSRQMCRSAVTPLLKEIAQCIFAYERSRLVVDHNRIDRGAPASRHGTVQSPAFPGLRPA